MAKINYGETPINNQSDFDAVISAITSDINGQIEAAVDAALVPIRESHAAEIAALNALLEKAREQNATADYSAYEAFPDLVELLKKTDLRPGALPSLCALEVWRGATTAKEISRRIPRTPKLGDKGDKESTPKMITSALQKLQKSLYTANLGVAVKVTSIRGPEGDSSVKKVRFVPAVEMVESEDQTSPTGDETAVTTGEDTQSQAAE